MKRGSENSRGLSPVERRFSERSGRSESGTKIPVVVVDNFPMLGFLTSLRFLEWVVENPRGVVSLPTGKTPEYFIKWTRHLLESWGDRRLASLRREYGLHATRKPDLSGLRFVQIDEFYPIDSRQHNSFHHYVRSFYLSSFGMDEGKALLIDCNRIPLAGGKSFPEVFPDSRVDLTLRHREPRSAQEALQQESILLVDDWCAGYEASIGEMGGIGFFLGGIGPDGHVAFNIRGSDPFSTTRLTSTNFETQAAAATDLGGMEVSRNLLVITLGLQTITRNPDATAILIAAGEAKAPIVKRAVYAEPSNAVPASALRKLANSRFYLTEGAAAGLESSLERYYGAGAWRMEKSERAVIQLCRWKDTYGPKLRLGDLKRDAYASRIPGLGKNTVGEVMESIQAKFRKGLVQEKNQVFLHTGPHHDDIMLGLLPQIAHTLRSGTNRFHFAVFTSGFTAVTNDFLKRALEQTRYFLERGRIEMVLYGNFYADGYRFKWDKDVYHYLNQSAARDVEGMRRGFCHRIVRALVDVYRIRDTGSLLRTIDDLMRDIDAGYGGAKDASEVQRLKGMLREFEEELVWAHFGVRVRHIHHLRLGFYTGDIFSQQPERVRDVTPFLNMLRKIRPTVVSLALDPEGSGPDTHYKVLQVIAEGLRSWKEEADVSGLRIWGYRNVWYRFRPWEADVIVPVSLNSMAALKEAFQSCYLSQVDAPFPSWEHDGPFSELAQKIWVEQLQEIQMLLGKEFFYQNPHPRIRACHGAVYYREMDVETFLRHARKLEESIEGMIDGEVPGSHNRRANIS